MKVLFQLVSLFIALASIGQVHSEDRTIATEQNRAVFVCESVKSEAHDYKTAINCKMSDGTKTNVMFKKDSNVEIIVGQ